ncbi:MAG: hypothetical protein QM813_22050 [Verrucomicrobiota bacterium]
MRYLLGCLWAGISLAAAQTPETESAVASSAATMPATRFDPDSTVYALTAVFILTFLLTFYVGVLYFRERRRRAASRMINVANQQPTDLSISTWQQRALNAEALADSQALLLREKLMPELTEFVKQSLVQGLAAQRDALLAMQQQALQSLLEMETRLANLNAPLQERIRAYETRIAELEKEISQQGAEMRELTRTILQLMRKKLEAEQEQTALETTFQ